MAQLTDILDHWDIPQVIAVERLHDEHLVFKVTTAGPTFTLKDISAAPNLRRLEWTARVLHHVMQAGVQVPLPLRTRSAALALPFQERFYTLTTWIEAGTYPHEPALQAQLFLNTGQAIARLHEALRSYPDADLRDQTWREDFAGRAAGWIAALCAGLPAQEAAIVTRVGRTHGDALAAALRALPEQVIHRDCHPGNILVDGTRVLGFIDCDHLCIGPRIFDLASYVVHHLKWVTHDPVASQQWLENLPHLLRGYQSQQPLTEVELVALPYTLLAYHLLLADWFLALPNDALIGVEVQALDWIDRHFNPITAACANLT
jgi:Ser/Thr protein kinase RdoA (MazF antagonist)